MARYDRIARIDPPKRGDAFPGWLAVRDLQGRERDKGLGRRARLRFLVVRVLHRLAGGLAEDGLNQTSLTEQADVVREELGQLQARDPERERLATFLKAASDLDVTAVTEAALDLAEEYEDGGQRYAAEEFCRAAMAVARAHHLDRLESRGQLALTRLTGETA